MNRYMMIAVAALGLAACGSPCEKAVKAAEDCAAEAGVEAETGEDVCADDDGSNDEYYECIADAYGSGDCSTAEGLVEVGTAIVTDCLGAGGTDTGAGS